MNYIIKCIYFYFKKIVSKIFFLAFIFNGICQIQKCKKASSSVPIVVSTKLSLNDFKWY